MANLLSVLKAAEGWIICKTDIVDLNTHRPGRRYDFILLDSGYDVLEAQTIRFNCQYATLHKTGGYNLIVAVRIRRIPCVGGICSL